MSLLDRLFGTRGMGRRVFSVSRSPEGRQSFASFQEFTISLDSGAATFFNFEDGDDANLGEPTLRDELTIIVDNPLPPLNITDISNTGNMTYTGAGTPISVDGSVELDFSIDDTAGETVDETITLTFQDGSTVSFTFTFSKGDGGGGR